MTKRPETYEEKKARLEKERKEQNAKVIKSYRIDTTAKLKK